MQLHVTPRYIRKRFPQPAIFSGVAWHVSRKSPFAAHIKKKVFTVHVHSLESFVICSMEFAIKTFTNLAAVENNDLVACHAGLKQPLNVDIQTK